MALVLLMVLAGGCILQLLSQKAQVKDIVVSLKGLGNTIHWLEILQSLPKNSRPQTSRPQTKKYLRMALQKKNGG